MRIAVMWRHFFERGGIALYTRRIVEHLLAIDRVNEYLLLVPPGASSEFAAPNLRLCPVDAGNRVAFDQWAAPRVAAKEGVDLVFNPKLSVPLTGEFRTAFMLHGMEQYLQAAVFPPLDRRYVKLVMPRYCRRADAIFCPSHTVKRDIQAWLDVPGEKITVTPHGVDRRFLDSVPEAELERVRRRYGLPEQYLLFVGGVTPLKNLSVILRAMRLLADSIPHQLVLSGFIRWRAGPDARLVDALGLGQRVQQIGWVAEEDQPAVYQMASALLMPSLYEGFGLPVIEAMASGCPVVVSTGGALPEVAGDAALVVDPGDPRELAGAVQRVLCDPVATAERVERGRRRADGFNWNVAAKLVLGVFETIVDKSPGRRASPAAVMFR